MKQFLICALLAMTAYCAMAADRGVCSRDGAICIIDLESGAETPITTGHTDMKPSWSIEGDMIVFFRVTRMRERVQDWHTAICAINADGSGFRQLTDGEFADYNPTWTRDGTNRIIYSRYFPGRARSVIHLIDLSGGTVTDEIISNPDKSEYALSALKDGRILIISNRAIFTALYYLFNPDAKPGEEAYQSVRYDFKMKGLMDRCSISADERKVTYEYKRGYSSFNYLGKVIYVADFDPATGTISNPQAISKKAPEAMTLYPRWTAAGDSVVYHSNRQGKARLYRYVLSDGTTTNIKGDGKIAYEFFCGERSPK